MLAPLYFALILGFAFLSRYPRTGRLKAKKKKGGKATGAARGWGSTVERGRERDKEDAIKAKVGGREIGFHARRQ